MKKRIFFLIAILVLLYFAFGKSWRVNHKIKSGVDGQYSGAVKFEGVRMVNDTIVYTCDFTDGAEVTDGDWVAAEGAPAITMDDILKSVAFDIIDIQLEVDPDGHISDLIRKGNSFVKLEGRNVFVGGTGKTVEKMDVCLSPKELKEHGVF